MPTYEYACPKCGHEFEQFQSMRDEPLKKCPKCKKTGLKRLVGSGAGLIFKGTGFYITDYKNKGAGKPEGGGKEGGAKEGGGKEGGSGEGSGKGDGAGKAKPADSKSATSDSKSSSSSSKSEGSSGSGKK
jgi:putative FmdB family regulatory protein